MLRNPFTRIRQDAQRLAQRAAQTPAAQAQTTSTALGVREAGLVDAATGAITPYGQLDFTPLDDADGFVLR